MTLEGSFSAASKPSLQVDTSTHLADLFAPHDLRTYARISCTYELVQTQHFRMNWQSFSPKNRGLLFFFFLLFKRLDFFLLPTLTHIETLSKFRQNFVGTWPIVCQISPSLAVRLCFDVLIFYYFFHFTHLCCLNNYIFSKTILSYLLIHWSFQKPS